MLKKQLYGLFDVGQRLLLRLPLADGPRKLDTLDGIASILILL